MTDRKNISSGTLWEEKVGYSRAVRIGNVVEVAGTTALDGKQVIGAHDAYSQTRFIIKKIEQALKEAGATLNDVVRTRMYLTDLTFADQVGKAHAEFFNDIKPVTTMIQISALVEPELLVEIEVTAIITE